MKLGRCSLPSIVWSLAAWILVLHLYTSIYHPPPRSFLSVSHTSSRRLPMYSELEEFEERATQIKSPRGKRRGNASNRPHRGRNISAAEDFINLSSEKRPLYFPDRVLAVNPLQCPRFDKYYYYPGREWLDTDGKPIQAHGGGILYVHKTKTFYWYGENKDGRTYRLLKRSLARASCQSKQKQFLKSPYTVISSPPGSYGRGSLAGMAWTCTHLVRSSYTGGSSSQVPSKSCFSIMSTPIREADAVWSAKILLVLLQELGGC